MHFKTNYVSYWTRFRKQFVAAFLILTAIILYSYFSKGQGYVNLTLQTTFILGMSYGLIQLYSTREFINDVKFFDDRMLITGYNFNSQWKIELKITDSKIEIKSKGRGRGNVEYFLRIKSYGKQFDINKSFNWDYSSLLGIFQEFKKRKGENVIFDEKYFLDIMEKKANRLS
jgi:hypothetical protein